jgi:hypothetical protein
VVKLKSTYGKAASTPRHCGVAATSVAHTSTPTYLDEDRRAISLLSDFSFGSRRNPGVVRRGTHRNWGTPMV